MLKFLLGANPYNITANEIGLPTSTATIDAGFTNIFQIVMTLVGFLAVIFILVSGIQMAASNGNASDFAKARNTLLYAVVGLVLSIAALAIVTVVADATK